MSLCRPSRCGCSFASDTLDITNPAAGIVQIELSDAYADAWPIFTFLNTTERDAELPVGVRQEGMEAFTRTDRTKYRFSGGAWRMTSRPLQAYSPTFTNLTLGTGASSSFQYLVADGLARVNGKIGFGVGFAISSNWSVTLPLPVLEVSAAFTRLCVQGVIFDSNTASMWNVTGEIFSGQYMNLYSTDSGDGKAYPVTASSPATIDAGDEFWFDVTYPVNA